MVSDWVWWGAVGLLMAIGLAVAVAGRWPRTTILLVLSPVAVLAALLALGQVADAFDAECHGDFLDGPYSCEPGGETVTGIGWTGMAVGFFTLPLSLGTLGGIGIRRYRRRG